MTQVDLAVFLVAGVLGGVAYLYSPRVAWAIIALWSLLKLLKVI